MESQAYMLVFEGEVVEGFDLERAKRNFQGIFRISREKMEELFAAPRVVVKKNLDRATAHTFQTQLHRYGLVTNIHPMRSAGQAGAPAKPVAPPVAAVVADGRPSQFEFHGKAGEYFKIWIVNILLSIITLGIYSAWAKVRNHRYFYSNTSLDGHSFEFTANPIVILKGRLIAAAFFTGYVLSTEFMPVLSLAFAVLFLVVFPWLVCKSLSFRNRNTAFRNIRFGFDGTYWDASKAFILWPIAGVLTIGLLMPYSLYKQKQFIVGNARYGTASFKPAFGPGDFYKIYFAAFGMAVLAGIAFVALGKIQPILGSIVIIPLYIFLPAYINAKSANLIYNHSQLQKHGFDSRIEVGRLAWIYFSNALVVGLTIGLAVPWAKIRLAAYRASRLRLRSRGSLDEFIAAEEKNVGSLGEEIGDVFDLDIGL